VSQKAVLLGAEGRGERPLYWEFFERGFDQALRLGRWKGVRHGVGQPIELYDLLADPSETRDLAPSRPDVVARIERSLREARIDSPLWPIPGLKTASPPGAER
jgi:arylsulfatase A-like enzyme